MEESKRYYFMAPPMMTSDRRQASAMFKRAFDDHVIQVAAEGTRIEVETKLPLVMVEEKVNKLLFSIKVPGAERIDSPD